MIEFRMSKYNPKYRENDIYSKDEWTSISDIGDIFNGKVFTQSEYLKIEGRYIACIAEIIRVNKVANCMIDSLEIYEETINWSNGLLLCEDQLLQFVQDCLREKCWGRLISKDFYIHFGYYYLVYIGCLLEKHACWQIVKKHGLYYEQIGSPYFCGGEEKVR